MTSPITLRRMINAAAGLCTDEPISEAAHEYTRGQIELIRDLAGAHLDVDEPDEQRAIIASLIFHRVRTQRAGHNYPPYSENDNLAVDRAEPVTEAQWKREHDEYEGGETYDLSPRLILVEWDDPTETPSEAIDRLNREVVDATNLKIIDTHPRPF